MGYIIYIRIRILIPFLYLLPVTTAEEINSNFFKKPFYSSRIKSLKVIPSDELHQLFN